MSLRLRLTLWYALILIVVIAIFGAAVWITLSISLRRQVDQTLLQTAERLESAGAVVRLENVLGVGFAQLDSFQASGLYVQVFDVEGRMADSTENLEGISGPLDPQALGSVRPVKREVISHGAHISVLTLPVLLGDRLIGYVQVGASLELVDQAESRLLLILLGGGLLSLFVTVVIGLATARRALKPLDTVTRTALQITRADDLSRRIYYHGPTNDEIGRLVTAFNDTLERLERLFNAQQRFLIDISHELRTPLTAVRGNVDLLRRMGDGDPDSLDAIQSETERMSRLVGDLMMLAQAESGSLPMMKQEVQLDTLLLETYREARVLAGRRVEIRLGEEDQARVCGDPDRLKQVLLNLVSNALKYTPDGGKIKLGLRSLDDWAKLTVSDTGRGIPQEDLPYIFERFYRVEKSRTRDGQGGIAGGAGLGLSIVKWLVEAHGGKIGVVSQIGHGSTFTVWLPLLKDQLLPQDERLETHPVRTPL